MQRAIHFKFLNTEKPQSMPKNKQECKNNRFCETLKSILKVENKWNILIEIFLVLWFWTNLRMEGNKSVKFFTIKILPEQPADLQEPTMTLKLTKLSYVKYHSQFS